RVPQGDGGARQVQAAVPGVRRAGPAHRVRRQRDELLRALPDRRPAAGGSRAVAAAQGRLAEDARGGGRGVGRPRWGEERRIVAAPMALATGTRLGNYEILPPLGSGGMGEVYRARDTRLGRSVAIKALPESLARDPERLSRLEREAQLLASVQHP